MKWEVRKVDDKWKVYLIERYCKTDAAVCYGAALSKEVAETVAERLNNPIHVDKL